MKISKTLTTGLAALALTLSMGAGAANIKSNEGVVQIDVTDLNLTSHEDQQVLVSRVKRAAESICGSQALRKAGSLYALTENKQCFNDAVDNAMASVDMHLVTVSATSSTAR
jgi:UrcA family protein